MEIDDEEVPRREMAIPRKPNKHEPTSLVVTHLPTEVSRKEIEHFFSEIGRVRRCHLVRDKEWQFKGMAYVQYAGWQDAARAKESLNRKQFMGSTLKVKFSRNQKKEPKAHVDKNKRKKYSSDLLQDENYGEEFQERLQKKKSKDRSKYDVNKDARKLRKGRIIIRNLSFKINEKIMEEHFSPYGKINEIQIMRKNDKKMAGYAFLQYETRMQALKAIQECNMKPILGRPVVVDLAVPKKQFESQTIKVEDSQDDIKEEEVYIKEEGGGESTMNNGKSMVFNYSNTEIKKEKLSDDEDNDSGLEDRDDSNSEGSDVDSDEDGSDVDSDEDGSDSDDESEEDKKPKGKQGRKPVSTPNASKDVAEERTIFIKNLNFDANEEDIASVLSKFGDLKYVLLCMDPLTEHPRGTAFAQFKEKSAAAACLAAEGDHMTKDQFIVLGRPMHVMKAVSRGNLQDRRNEEESSKKVKDKRNLYLAREGFVRQGTQAAAGISPADMNLRQLRERVKRRMLKNLNVFVSTTRLCVNNLPEKLDDAGLRKIFVEHGEPGSKVTEARIMRNLREIGDDGKPKSRGYGFVSFTEHEHALAALRKINNNPNVFTPIKRPIIEFSLENREIIRAREKRLEKSREKNPLWNKGKQTKQKGKEGQSKKQSADTNEASQDQSSFMGSKSDPSAGVKNALPANIGPKIRQRAATGKITRKQLKKQRQDLQKGRKRLRVHDDAPEEPSTKILKPEEMKKEKKKNKKKNNKRLPKDLKRELRRDKSFNDMVNQYKQKMASVNTESSSKKWYED